MPRIIDISLPLDSTTVIWPGLEGFHAEASERIACGGAVNVTNLRFCAHTGTHVDAPFHHFADGGGVERIPMSGLVGPAVGMPGVPLRFATLDSHDVTRFSLLKQPLS